MFIKERLRYRLADFFTIKNFQAIPADFTDHYKQLSLCALYGESSGPILFQAGARLAGCKFDVISVEGFSIELHRLLHSANHEKFAFMEKSQIPRAKKPCFAIKHQVKDGSGCLCVVPITHGNAGPLHHDLADLQVGEGNQGGGISDSHALIGKTFAAADDFLSFCGRDFRQLNRFPAEVTGTRDAEYFTLRVRATTSDHQGCFRQSVAGSKRLFSKARFAEVL